jgi:hypothetical protein
MWCGWLTRGPKRDGGPGVSGGVGERAGKRGRVVMGHRQVGPGNTVPRRWFKRDLKEIPNSNVSNKFQTVSNFGQLEKHFPGLRKIEIKYDFEDL